VIAADATPDRLVGLDVACLPSCNEREGSLVDVETLADSALVALGALFARTAGKVGQDLADAATTAAASKVAELVCRRLGPDHPLARALRQAQREPGTQPQPTGLEAELRELAKDPQFAAMLQQLVRSNISFAAGSIAINQQGAGTAVVGEAIILGSESATATPRLSDGADIAPLPDQAQTSLHISQHDVAVAVVGQAEIHFWRGPPDPARQLEAVRGFVGRHAEVRRLHRWLRRRDDQAPVAVVIGEPGVGKTDLALLVANQLARSDYPDLQLQVRLPGDQAGAATDPGEALARLLPALGVLPEDIPYCTEQRANRYRAALSGRRALVLIDGATSDHQVEPLLPPRGCAAIVTTRGALPAVLEKGAEQLSLRTLSRGEALALLVARLGRNRVARQPWGAVRLIDACGRLPQALVIVAALLATPAERHTPLGQTARELRQQPLRPGTRVRSLAAAFRLSYHHLPDQQRHTFQLLGLLNTTDIDTATAAAAAAVSPDEIERRLKTLANASLLHGRPGQWRLRPLLLGYARECADTELTQPARSAALARALDYQLRHIRSHRRKIDAAGLLDPTRAAQLQADLDRALAHGAALVDVAVADALDLVGLVADDLADVLHEVITNWPDPQRARQAVTAIRRVAAGGPTPAARDRASAWLEHHPQLPTPPAPGSSGPANSPLLPHVPTAEEMRQYREWVEHLNAAEAADPTPLWVVRPTAPDDAGGTILVKGFGFLPGEPLSLHLDNGQGWNAAADDFGNFTTSTTYGPQSRPPRRVTVTGGWSGIHTEGSIQQRST